MTGIYARVSTEEQAEKGYSLQDQIRECKKTGGSGPFIEYIDKGISGELLDRPALSRLRQDIADGIITKVVCFDPDRLSRKLINQLILSDEIEKKSKLIFVNGEYSQTAEGKLFYQLRGAVSEFEKAKINERMSRGRKEKALQGFVVKDYQIFGYNYNSDKKKLEVNKEECEVVKLIFNKFTGNNGNNTGISGIARYLTQLGIPTKRGAKFWHRQVVRQILMNRTYIGEFYQNRWLAEGTLTNKFKPLGERSPVRERPKKEWIKVPCPAIIDKEIFNYAQKLLEESRRRWAGSSKHSYLLSGLLRCGICGNTMTGKKIKNWSRYIFTYSDIKHSSNNAKKGCGMVLETELIENIIWGYISDYLKENARLIDSDIEPDFFYDSYKNEMSIAENNLKALETKLHNLSNLSLLSQTVLNTEALEQLMNEISSLDKKRNDVIKIKNDIIKEFELKNLKKNMLSFSSLDRISFTNKQKIIRFIAKEIIVYNDKIEIFGF